METDGCFKNTVHCCQKATSLKWNCAEYGRKTTSLPIDFFLNPYPLPGDTTITVAESEIQEYYQENKHQYEQIATRDIEYVVFPIEPSEKTSLEARAAIDDLYTKNLSPHKM